MIVAVVPSWKAAASDLIHGLRQEDLLLIVTDFLRDPARAERLLELARVEMIGNGASAESVNATLAAMHNYALAYARFRRLLLEPVL